MQKMNIWTGSKALRANMKFCGQSVSKGNYLRTFQQARRRFITFPLIFISLESTKRVHFSSIWSNSDEKGNLWASFFLLGLFLFYRNNWRTNIHIKGLLHDNCPMICTMWHRVAYKIMSKLIINYCNYLNTL